MALPSITVIFHIIDYRDDYIDDSDFIKQITVIFYITD